MKKPNLNIRTFFADEKKVEHYIVRPRKVYSRVQRVTRLLSNVQPTDIFIQVCGLENCPPSKLPVEGAKSIYSMHYVLQGEGYFIVENEKYHLSECAVFCAMKNKTNSYYPDTDNPWSYIFIGFGGVLVDSIMQYLGMDDEHCVIPAKKTQKLKRLFYEIYERFNEGWKTSFRVLSTLYELLAELEDVCCKPKKNVDDPTKNIYKALEFIRNNIANVTVEMVADACHLNRIYLSRIMKKKMGVSLHEAITVSRLFVATDYLKYLEKDRPIGEIAHMVGYADAKHFSKLFKSVFDMTPTEYREQVDEK